MVGKFVKPKTLDLSLIRTDGGTQSRAIIDQEVIRNYAEDMLKGDEFPAVEVFFDGESYWLVNGFHRVFAARQAGFKQIGADVREGTLEEAWLASRGANRKNGLHRSNADKHASVESMLLHEKYVYWTDGRIAEVCAVTQKMVSDVRSELVASQKISEIDERIAIRDGKEYTVNTSNIGSKPKPADEQSDPGRDAFEDYANRKGLVDDDRPTDPPVPQSADPSEDSALLWHEYYAKIAADHPNETVFVERADWRNCWTVAGPKALEIAQKIGAHISTIFIEQNKILHVFGVRVTSEADQEFLRARLGPIHTYVDDSDDLKEVYRVNQINVLHIVPAEPPAPAPGAPAPRSAEGFPIPGAASQSGSNGAHPTDPAPTQPSPVINGEIELLKAKIAKLEQENEALKAAASISDISDLPTFAAAIRTMKFSDDPVRDTFTKASFCYELGARLLSDAESDYRTPTIDRAIVHYLTGRIPNGISASINIMQDIMKDDILTLLRAEVLNSDSDPRSVVTKTLMDFTRKQWPKQEAAA